ncbi:gas vesicle protein K [Planosporangium flavigriseum]|uniref:Gas vesicle protein GvpK n=1 Tax=Planosporangium flavigriseum TaxID=373681 RepID=A0A8J3PMF6_9ACTN|nr:gas vesicle protein K [Planosporangium flavigriseum]NJC63987.1 gas vesicle protein K [Planosporangium flavigriseum]GIG72866.1 gas vesicle protein GvpK [Planosporangium flavigriseum]
MNTPLRFDIDPEDAGRGLGRLVIALLEIVRQLLERQALRRVDAGSLTDDEIERLGRALLALDQRFTELREIFDISADDIRLSNTDLDRLAVTEPPPPAEKG